MPLQINAGLSRKIGQPNYGSRGAGVSFEVDVEPTLVRQPDQLRDKTRCLFQLAEDAVEEQLADGQPPRSRQPGDPPGNGNSGSGGACNRPATAGQLRAMHALAARGGSDLATRLEEFGVARPEDLSVGQASRVIERQQSLEPGGCP